MQRREHSFGDWSWIDIVAPAPDEIERVGEDLQLDPDVVDLLLDIEQTPKLVELPGAQRLLVLHALRGSGVVLDTIDIYFILSDELLVTIAAESVPAIDAVWSHSTETEIATHDPIEVAARVMEVAARRFLDAAVAIQARIDDLDERAVTADPTILPDVHTLRREESTVRRMLNPQIAAAIAIRPHPDEASRATIARINGAITTLERAADEFQLARTMLTDVLEVYRGAVAEKTNEVTRVLTVYAAIMLPLSIVVGFWGMNFVDLPLLDGHAGWISVTVLMIVVGFGSWAVFRWRGFIGGPSLRDLPSDLGRGVASVAKLPISMTRLGGRSGQSRPDRAADEESDA